VTSGIDCLSEGELTDPVTEDDLLQQAGRLLDKAYAHEILGDVLYVTDDGQWKVATVEVVLGEAHPSYLRDRLTEFLEEVGEDHPLASRAVRKLQEVSKMTFEQLKDWVYERARRLSRQEVSK